jgi:uncharacterized protein YaaQ
MANNPEMPTKLIMAVVPDDLAGAALDAFLQAGCRVTRIASTGGFLHTGSTTLLAGVEAARLGPALAAVRSACQAAAKGEERGKITVFVLDVTQSERL